MSSIMRWALALASIVVFAQTAKANERIKLGLETNQSVYVAGEANKAYVRIRLEGLPYEEAAARPPVNLAIVIDKSGSMTGPKIEQAKEAAIVALSRLTPRDHVSVIAFDNQVEVVVPHGPFQNFEEMKRRIERIRPGGSTAIYAAVRQAASNLSETASPDMISRIILMSDGMANVGPSSPAELEQLGREIGGHGIAVTTIGLGLDYSEDLMTRLALASDGNHAFVENPDQLSDIFNKEFGDVFSVVGQDIDIDLDCPEGIKPIRALGREVKIDGRHLSFRLNQIGSHQERYLVLELEVSKDLAKAGAPLPLANVQVSYVDPKLKQRAQIRSETSVTFSTSKEDADRSINASVSTDVTRQLVTERSEKAVISRDQGKIEDAKKQMLQNAADLRAQAAKVQPTSPAAAAALQKQADKSEAEAAAFSGSASDYNRARKAVRAEQYKEKTQQNY